MTPPCPRCRQRETTERARRKRWKRRVQWNIDQRYTAIRERVARQLQQAERQRAEAVAQAHALRDENAELRRLLGFSPKRAAIAATIQRSPTQKGGPR